MKEKMKLKNEIWTATNIGDEGARMIGELLKTNTTLTRLNLDSDEIIVFNVMIIRTK